MMRITHLIPLVLLAGCASQDPYRRTDVWYPTGSNEGNIAAQAIRPRDLIAGRSVKGGEDARLSANAVERVWQGQDKALPSVSTAPSAAAPAPAPVSAAPTGAGQ
jgi:type IV pilus biogenesis protein CpaD/CtpE